MKKLLKVLVVLAFGAFVFVFARHWTLRDEATRRVRELPALAAMGRVVPIRVVLESVTNRVEVGLEVQWATRPKELFGELLRTVPGAVPPEAWPGMIEAELERFTLENDDWYARVIPYWVVVRDAE